MNAGPKGDPGQSIIPFHRKGTLSVTVGDAVFRFPTAALIVGVSAVVGTPSAGAPILFDVLLDGVAIPEGPFSILAGDTDLAEVVTAAAAAAGDHGTVDIVGVGSSVSGSDMSVMVRYTI